MDSNALITYKQLINNVLAAVNEDSSEFWRYEAIGLNVITDFQLNHMESVQMIEATMDINHRIPLPDDCIRVKAIGYPKGGRLWTLTRDDSIYTGQTMLNGVLSSDSDTLEIRNNHQHGYGAVGSNKYTFTIDYVSRAIVILGIPITQMNVYYLSSGINMKSDTLIPIEAQLALQAAIIHQSTVFDKKVTNAYSQRVESQYKEEVYKLRRYYATLTVDEWHDLINRNSSQTVIR